jgi:DNA sulfur modification protein DndE
VALKAGRERDGLRVGIPTENIVIRNCRGRRGHGGIVIGSETAGGIRNVYATRCQFKGTDRIVRIKTARGRGGTIENLWFSELTGESILREAIHVNMLYEGTRLPEAAVSDATPRIRNIYFENIACLSGESYAIEVLGLPEMPVGNLWFEKFRSHSKNGINLSDVRGVHIGNSTVEATHSPLVNLVDVQQMTIDAVRLPRRSGQVLHVEGGRSGDIVLRKTNVGHAGREIFLGPGVLQGAVSIEQ